MDSKTGYGQFCPVAMAAEIICTRWTALVLRELCSGSTRFNELRRGVPRMSPTLLAKRLRELENAGVIERSPTGEPNGFGYHLTEAGQDLKPIIFAMGAWGQRWVEAQTSLKNLDPALLMWDMRRNLDPTPMPPRRCVIQFHYPELPQAQRTWWLLVERDETDLCSANPGFEVDLYVVTSLHSMTAIWMGLATVRQEERAGRLELTGDPEIRRSMQSWLGLSPFAKEPKRVSA